MAAIQRSWRRKDSPGPDDGTLPGGRSFPLEKEDGTPLDDQDRKKILHSGSGYASKVAKMVSLTTIFKEVPCPPTPVQSDDDVEEADKSA